MLVSLAVNAISKQWPVLLAKVVILHAVAIADLADSHSLKDTAGSELLKDDGLIEVTHLD